MSNNNSRVVCFGEVLWDILPTGKVPGGAPMNVAYHLHKHGIKSNIITRIGDDEPGEEIIQWFANKGLDTAHFQVDPVHPTGKVFATPDSNGNMRYDILKPVAWDFIALEETDVTLVQRADYFVYGSLASRSVESRATLHALLERAATKVLDINLRPPHFQAESLLELISTADILKLNEEELELVASLLATNGNAKDAIRQISDRFGIKTIVVTRGANGALLYSDGAFFEHPGYEVVVADTVGSGDAFLAGLLSKMIEGTIPGEALLYAVKTGAFVAGRTGGCPVYDVEEIEHAFSSGERK